MKFDSSIQAAGNQCGVDVEALYKKYSLKGASGETSTADSNGKMTTDGTATDTGNTNTTSLDRMRICKRCHGLGLMKHIYNHQVREVNCIECDGDGVIDCVKTGNM